MRTRHGTFLFWHSAGELPHYDEWTPKYSITFSGLYHQFAFGPDTLPLTRRAKMIMLLQSTVSLVTLTELPAAINMLAGA